MNLSQRTVRITLASLFSIIAAAYLGLENSMAAGIIALLSILDTRLETVKTGLQRVISTILAFLIATIVFLIFGFSVYSFGVYLALYIPLAHLANLEAGIPPCSVLVTHFVIAESVSWHWQVNGISLMVIGVVFAWLFSIWLPSYDKKLDKHVVEVERKMSSVLSLFERRLAAGSGSLEQIKKELTDLSAEISSLDKIALIEYENSYFTQSIKDYYVKYAQMRQQQYEILNRMVALLPNILSDTEENRILASIFSETAEQLDEENPGTKLLNRINELYDIFRKSELPKTRAEFESRAILYDMLTDFENFLVLKHDFYIERKESDNAR